MTKRCLHVFTLILICLSITTSLAAADSPVEGELAPFLGEPELNIQPVFQGGRFPNVVVTMKGTVLATWGRPHIRAKRSEDGGKTWGDDITIAKSGYHGGGTTVDETTGDILAFVEEEHPPAPLTVYRSKDDGKTWQAEPVAIRPDSEGRMPSMHMNEHGITLRHGEHKGRLIRPSRFYGKGNRPESIWPTHFTNAMYSDDGGKTWQTSEPFPENGTGEATIAELSDGRIYYNSRRHWAPEGKSPLRRWTAWSDDGGATWKNGAICEVLPDGPQDTNYGCMGGLVRLPIKDKDILIYSNCDSPKGRSHGTVWASFDGGKTWPLKRLVHEGSFAYSSLTAGRPGTPSEGNIYLHFESGGSKVARFNLSWLLAGKTTGDGAVPEVADDGDSTRDRFLFLDNRIVEKSENAQLAVGTVRKHESNPLFIEDKPWEKRFDNLYGNVIFDAEEKIYKCWYSPFIVDRSAKGMTLEQRQKKYSPGPGREMGICYATSKDGINWNKPDLGLVDYEGSKKNNIVWRGPHGAGIWKDDRDSDPARRYKMIFQGIATSHSPDGINWSQPKKVTGIGKIAGDTHNNAFWDPHSRKYLGFTRTWGDLGREVTRIESSDFQSWQSNGVVMTGLEKGLQTYAMPVFMHGGVYLGLVAIHAQRPVDRVWTELAWSPDSKNWHRIAPGKALIPCSENVLEYDYGCVYACAYPVFLDSEIRLYYGGSDYLHYGWRNGSLCLATLRPDGFAGYEQESKDKPAVITTTAISYARQEIRITADLKKGGSIIVSLIDDKGQEIAKAGIVSKTVTDGRLKWSQKISGDNIRLKFELNNAKLYSFSFAP